MEVREEKLSKALSGISGEYFVAGELSRHGFIAAVTLRNTRGVDILVSRPGGNRSATVQVKTLQNSGPEWVLSKSDELSKGENHYYIFVALHGCKGRPDYFVVEGDHVSKCCRDSHQEWLKGKNRDGSDRKDNDIRVFRPTEDCREAWDRIRV